MIKLKRKFECENAMVEATQISLISEEARAKLKNNDELYHKNKAAIVNEYADKLSKVEGIDPQTISTIVAKELKDIVGKRWIMEILPPEYKMQYRRNNAAKCKSSRVSAAKLAAQTEQPLQLLLSPPTDLAMIIPTNKTETGITMGKGSSNQRNNAMEPSPKFYDILTKLQIAVRDGNEKAGKKAITDLRLLCKNEGFPDVFSEHFINEALKGKSQIGQYQYGSNSSNNNNNNNNTTSSSEIKTATITTFNYDTITVEELDTWSRQDLITMLVLLIRENKELRARFMVEKEKEKEGGV